MSNRPYQGENVHLTFSSTAAAATPSPLTVLDANMKLRTLLSTERLVIDDLQGNLSSGSADIIAGSTGNASTLIASFNTAVGLDLTAKEGVSLPVGVVPNLLPVGSGSTAVIKVAGNGRIVEGTTTGVRPTYREATVRGD
jgi:hypothetical protein